MQIILGRTTRIDRLPIERQALKKIAYPSDLVPRPWHGPDLNPIEMAFAKLRAHLRRIKVRSIDALWRAVGDICDLYTPEECWNCLKTRDTPQIRRWML